MKRLFKYLSIIGVFCLLYSCQPQDVKTEISASVITPTITSMPTISFIKSMASDTIVFRGTKVNPGYQASATYYLEVDTAGDNFAHAILVTSGISDSAFYLTVSSFNSTLLSLWNPYVTNHLEFRIRAVFDQSNAGSGVAPIVSISPTISTTAVLYGLPQLNLVGTEIAGQNVQSLLSDGNFSGLVKLSSTIPFTLVDPISGNTYGLTGSQITLGGTGTIAVVDSGWYVLTVDVNTGALAYTLTPNMVGMIGTFNSWDSPDHKMDYAKRGNFWYTTVPLLSSDGFKFRINDSWPGDFNWGEPTGGTGYTGLITSGSSGNIPSPGTATWYVTLSVAASGTSASCTLTNVGAY